MNRPRRRAPTAALALMALAALTSCGAGALYNDSLRSVQGAVDGLRRAGSDPLDPDTVDALSAGAVRGALRGAGVHGPLEPFIQSLVQGLLRSFREELTRAVESLLASLATQLGGSDPANARRGLLGRVVADARPELVALVHQALGASRAQLHGATVQLSADVDGRLRPALAATARDATRGAVEGAAEGLPALRRQLEREVDPALQGTLEHASAAVVRGARGELLGTAEDLRRELRGALNDVRESFIDKDARHALYLMVAALALFILVLYLLTRRLIDRIWSEARETIHSMTAAVDRLATMIGRRDPSGPAGPSGSPGGSSGGPPGPSPGTLLAGPAADGAEHLERPRFRRRLRRRPRRPAAPLALLALLALTPRPSEAQPRVLRERWTLAGTGAVVTPVALDGLAVVAARAISNVGEGCPLEVLSGDGRRHRALLLDLEPGTAVALLRIGPEPSGSPPEGLPVVSQQPDLGAPVRVVLERDEGRFALEGTVLRADPDRVVVQLDPGARLRPSDRVGAVVDPDGWLLGVGLDADPEGQRVVATGAGVVRALLRTTHRTRGYPACHVVFGRTHFATHFGLALGVAIPTAGVHRLRYQSLLELTAFDDYYFHLSAGGGFGAASALAFAFAGGGVLTHNQRDGLFALGARLELEFGLGQGAATVHREGYGLELRGAAYLSEALAFTASVAVGAERQRVDPSQEALVGASVALRIGLSARLSDPDR